MNSPLAIEPDYATVSDFVKQSIALFAQAERKNTFLNFE